MLPSVVKSVKYLKHVAFCQRTCRAGPQDLPDISSEPGAAGAAAAAEASPPVDSVAGQKNMTASGQNTFSHFHRSMGAKKGKNQSSVPTLVILDKRVLVRNDP